MNCTIRRDLCHSHRTQHKGSRILARASRAQFGLGIQVVFVAYLSANFLVRHSGTDTSSTKRTVSRAILHPKPWSIRLSDRISNSSAPFFLQGHQVCPDIRCSCQWISYRILRTAEKLNPKERKEKRARLVPRLISFAVPWIPKVRPCAPSGTFFPPPRRWVFGPGTPAPPRRGPLLRGVGPSFRPKNK